jgi:membrane protease YdiL (CAAX protease family)
MIADKPNFIKRSELDWHLLEQGRTTALVSPSFTIVTLLEVISVVFSVIIINWAIVPIYPYSRWPLIVPVLLTLTFIMYSQAKHGESWGDLGFSQRYFSASLRLLFLPVAFSCVVLLAVGYITNSIHRSTHFGANLFVVPFWGVVQQYVLQGFFYRRIRFLSFRVLSVRATQSQKIWLAILSTAGLFAIVHLPNLTLASLTLIAAIMLTWVYEQAPNIWALGLSHGVLSLVLMHSLPLQYLHSMSVGYKHFLYQQF